MSQRDAVALEDEYGDVATCTEAHAESSEVLPSDPLPTSTPTLTQHRASLPTEHCHLVREDDELCSTNRRSSCGLTACACDHTAMPPDHNVASGRLAAAQPRPGRNLCAGRLWRSLRSWRLPRATRWCSSAAAPSCLPASCMARSDVGLREQRVTSREDRDAVAFVQRPTDSQHSESERWNCPPVHTTVDYVHRLVPDLQSIVATSFYWGRMDRYEAERLLEGRPEGTFLLRDSAQHEYLFSVSFRRYMRSLHARVDHVDGRFTFDCHDPGVFSSDTVVGLMAHYKEPSSCMFFEPMLTRPLHRTFVFSLAQLCRATIIPLITYDNINRLQLPRLLKHFLMEYHYRQPVQVRRHDLAD